MFGAYTRYWIPKEHRNSKVEAPGKLGIWVGRSRVTPDAHVVVPIEWDPSSNMWLLGNTVVAASVQVDDESFPLREGPGNTSPASDEEVKKFMDKYTLPYYKLAEGTPMEQEVPGVDPELEVEAIKGKKFSGTKARYLVQWKVSFPY